jgi:signal transduction histidine kinase
MHVKESTTYSDTSAKESFHRAYSWTQWLMPKPFDRVSSSLYVGALIPYIYCFVTHSGYEPPLVLWQVMLMIATTAFLLLIDRVEYFLYADATPRNAAIVLLLARIAGIEILSWLDQFRYSPFLYFIVLYLTCMYFGELASYGVAFLVWLVYILKHMHYTPHWLYDATEIHYLVLFTVGIVLITTIARAAAKEKASREHAEELFSALEISHRQLQEYAGQVAELATTRERNRVARDIHDSLGHYLTVINVQLEKALALREKKPEEAVRAVSDAKHLASEALQDVRRSVGALRTLQELPKFSSSLTELVERIRSDTCTVTLNMEGSEDSFPKQGLLALYRAAQEGLTNIQKHASASHIWLDLHFNERDATLSLRDNGQGFDTTKRVNGCYGLQGVSERLDLVGGNLQVESMPGQGTTLLVKLLKNGN